MAEGGEYDGDRDPLIPHPDDGDDDGDATGEFDPPDSSSRRPSGEQIPMNTMNRPPERGPRTAETSFTEASGGSNLIKQFRLEEAQRKIQAAFPEYGRENPQLDLSFNTDGKIIAKGLRGGEIKVFKADGKSFLADFLNKFKITLGANKEDFLAKQNNEVDKISGEIAKLEKIVNDRTKTEEERRTAGQNIKAELDKKNQLLARINEVKKQTQAPEEIELQDLRAQREERIEWREELTQQNEQDRVVVEDQNEEPAVRERARENIQERQEEINEIDNEVARIDERLSLRERIRNRVKEIFKKYGFTITAVLLAVGTTIGVIVSSLSKGLATVANGVGNGLKALGKKIGSILPGLLGAIVSFVFRAAGQVISFLGKNAWLLILAVAAFLIESVSKRR